jgi:hypothetical protein
VSCAGFEPSDPLLKTVGRGRPTPY